MKSFGKVEQDYIQKIEMEQEDEDWNYEQLQRLLQNGLIFALRIECFPALTDLTKKQYTGKLSYHYQNVEYTERSGPKDRSYHAVICIGIKQKKGKRPPMLLLQDSCYQPFRLDLIS
mmetsp:Transcript_27873/g.42480  ORF Transcript_27873/g.42480 Transcript_27873/m.42480 type:complete len:117 (+) Transcript_27873:820-1170(+)